MKISPNIPEEWKSQFITPIVMGDFLGEISIDREEIGSFY